MLMLTRGRIVSLGLFAVLALSATAVRAQGDEMPKPDEEPTDASTFSQEQKEEEMSIAGPDGKQRRIKRMQIVMPNSYRSPTLKGRFRMQWMYIIQRGQMKTFWGARIVQLDPDSPVWQLGVRPGDVLTRLDGIPLWRRMHKGRDGVWQIPEMERHYGLTEVRYIRQGTHIVRVGQMLLDGSVWDEESGLEPLAP